MKKVTPALLVAVCIAAFAFASPQQTPSTPPNDHTAKVPGRFQINTDAWSDPILLDTVTGDMWTLTESTNLVEARMVAWIPMRRISGKAEVETWAAEGRERHDRYLAKLKAESVTKLQQMKNNLGADHPNVIKFAKEIGEHPFFKHVTDTQLEAAKQELLRSTTEIP